MKKKPEYPAYMKPQTVAWYLDYENSTSVERLRKRFPDFPKKNKLTSRTSREEIDNWMNGNQLPGEDELFNRIMELA